MSYVAPMLSPSASGSSLSKADAVAELRRSLRVREAGWSEDGEDGEDDEGAGVDPGNRLLQQEVEEDGDMAQLVNRLLGSSPAAATARGPSPDNLISSLLMLISNLFSYLIWVRQVVDHYCLFLFTFVMTRSFIIVAGKMV